jgi:hypothetical protein
VSVLVRQWAVRVHDKALCLQVVAQISWVVGDHFGDMVQVRIVHLVLFVCSKLQREGKEEKEALKINVRLAMALNQSRNKNRRKKCT